MHSPPIRLTFAALAGLATLSAAPMATPVAAATSTPQACFWGHDADGFNAPDDRTVYVSVGMRQVYKLTLFAPCIDIDWNQRIALVSQGGGDWICEGNGLNAEIRTRTDIGPQRCQVDSIHKLTPAEIAALPKKDRP